MSKSRVAVRAKLTNLGLCVEDAADEETIAAVSSSSLPGDLPSVESQLKVLSAALTDLRQPGLSHNEVLRLRTIILGVKTYKELFADFLDYRALEDELVEVNRELEAQTARSAAGKESSKVPGA